MNKTKPLLHILAPIVLLTVQSSLWAFVWIYFYSKNIPNAFQWKGELLLAALYFVILFVITNFYGGLRIDHRSASELGLSCMIALLFANTVTYAQTCLISAAIVTLIPILAMTAAQCVLIWMWAALVNRIYGRAVPPLMLLMLYDGSKAAKRLTQKLITRSAKYQITQSLRVTGDSFDSVCPHILGFEAVILCDIPFELRKKLQRFCFINSIPTYTVPGIEDILTRSSVETNLLDTPLLLSRNEGLINGHRAIKRTLDILLSAVALIVLSPIALLISIAIKLCDGGSIVFSQERLTIGGRRFMLHKFRSMRADAEENGAQLSTQGDNRITVVGKVMRPLRLDEIPQLINILKGDMSIVGPRPERPEMAEEYMEDIPEFAYRLKVKAGLTGYAQVYGNYNTDPWDKLLMDLVYISSCSLALDIKIILMTVKTIFQRERTYGIADGNATPRRERM